MKIAITSDTHELEPIFPEADYFIHCGDITNFGGISAVKRFAKKLNKTKYKAGAIIPGNHDGAFQDYAYIVKEFFEPRFKVLIDRGVVWEGIRIWGTPWTPPAAGAPNQFKAFTGSYSTLARIFDRIPRNLDILVTHGPPYEILDMVNAQIVTPTKTIEVSERKGSLALAHAVNQRNIRHHVFGHIHGEGGKQLTIGDYTAHNVAAAWDGKLREPLILEIDTRS